MYVNLRPMFFAIPYDLRVHIWRLARRRCAEDVLSRWLSCQRPLRLTMLPDGYVVSARRCFTISPHKRLCLVKYFSGYVRCQWEYHIQTDNVNVEIRLVAAGEDVMLYIHSYTMTYWQTEVKEGIFKPGPPISWWPSGQT